MISQDEAREVLNQLKQEYIKQLPMVVSLAQLKTVSNSSMSLVHNRISIKKYNDRYALKRSFYKPITIQHPGYDKT